MHKTVEITIITTKLTPSLHKNNNNTYIKAIISTLTFTETELKWVFLPPLLTFTHGILDINFFVMFVRVVLIAKSPLTKCCVSKVKSFRWKTFRVSNEFGANGY